jgi:energy-coupling factor transporter ATP-binding protein EcfA2
MSYDITVLSYFLTMNSHTEQISGISLLIDWANAQDHWIRALVNAVLEIRHPLSEVAITKLYELMLQEKGLYADDCEPILVPPIEYEGGICDQESALVLQSLSDVSKVNALASNQSILFNSNMTLLYGENGAGKTGYVRILKQLASVRTAEAILPNIDRTEDIGPPSATIEYQVGQATQQYKWSGEEGIPPFTHIDVFDSRCVDIHVDDDLPYCYTPTDLAAFRYVHEGIEAVKSRLDKAQKETLPSGNPFLNKFSRDGSLYAKIDTLGPTTDLSELVALANVRDEEEAELVQLTERVNALQSKTTDAQLKVASDEADVLQRVLDVLKVAEVFDFERYHKAIEDIQSAEKAHIHATKEALLSYEIPGVLNASWQSFIEAGEAYLSEHSSPEYPTTEDACPYCLQPLTAAAIELIQKYREFCRNALQAAVKKAREEYNNTVSALNGLTTNPLIEELVRRIHALSSESTQYECLVAASSFVRSIDSMQKAIAAQEESYSAPIKDKISTTRPLIDARLSSLTELIQGLREDLERRKSLLQEEKLKLQTLQDRITLRELLPGIRKYVESAKWSSQAKTLLNRFANIGRTLTENSKLASEHLLNKDFEDTFVAECEALRAPKVILDFPGRRGQPARRKSLSPQYRLSATLSEGEQKVIALADFIAEALLRRSPTPLVLDDPVTSLDYRRLQHVVDRLVELSQERQVIIFTHNIWFTMELLSRFDSDRKACSYFDISEEGMERGIVSAGSSPRLDTWSDKKKRINLIIERIKKESDTYIQNVLLEKAYDDLRSACELVVEQNLLQAVVQSYRPNIMIGNLQRVHFDKLPEASNAIIKIFERCCRFTSAHKQPLETLNVRPLLSQLQEDWSALQKVHSDFSK